MSASPRVLLAERLDAIGASSHDARLHVQALRAAGAVVRACVGPSADGEDLLHGTRAIDGGDGRSAALDARSLVREIAEFDPDLVLIASASPDPSLASAASSVDVRHWCTAFTAGGEAAMVAPFDASLAGADGFAFDASALRRARLSLWDGPYVLSMGPLDAGEAMLACRAFAEAADGRDELDLVVLAEPDDALAEAARRAGVAQRVHAVGRTPLEAEIAWLQNARVALAGGRAPLGGARVLRALGAGCALVPLDTAGGLRGWLHANGASWAHAHATGAAAEALEAALDGSAAVARATARGREVAAAHDAGSLAKRIGSALEALPGRRRAA